MMTGRERRDARWVGAGICMLLFGAATGMAGVANAKATPWSAQWIWRAEDGPANAWMCLRGRLHLDRAPATAPTRIAAENRYWLWINGQEAVFDGGLKRGPAPNTGWYDTIDLAPRLRQGQNSVAALVWHAGKSSFDLIHAGKGGFLLEMDLGGRRWGTDATWKASTHPAFGASTHKLDRRLAETSVLFDAGKDIPGWVQAGFDDTAWPGAVVKGSPPVRPWGELWPRPIPLWRDHGRHAFPDAPPLPLKGGDSQGKDRLVVLSLPTNLQFTPWLKVRDALGGHQVRVCPGSTGNKSTPQHAFITRAGEQDLEGWFWATAGATAKVHLVLPAGVEVLDLGYRETSYDCDLAGSFTCGDKLIDTYWKQAQRTCFVNMRDTLMGCPDRERGGFLGDQNVAFLYMPYCLAPAYRDLVGLCVRNICRWQKPNGALPCVAPGTFNGEFPAMTLAYIGHHGLWGSYRHTGDRALLAEAFPAFKRYLELWTFDSDGLPIERPGGMGNWKDWGPNQDARLLIAAWWISAADGFGAMAKEIGRAGEAGAITARLASVKEKFGAVFWDGSAFRAPAVRQKPPDDRGNALAVCLGLTGEKERAPLRAVLTTSLYGSPMMEGLALEALVRLGDTDAALDRLRKRFAYVLKGTHTLGENWGPANHAYAGGGLNVLSGLVAGLEPIEPGWKRFACLPRPGSLTSIVCEVPAPVGPIRARIQRTFGNFSATLEIEAPAGSICEAGLPLSVFPGRLPSILSLDDRQAWTATAPGEVIQRDGFLVCVLTAGKHVLNLRTQPGQGPREGGGP